MTSDVETARAYYERKRLALIDRLVALWRGRNRLPSTRFAFWGWVGVLGALAVMLYAPTLSAGITGTDLGLAQIRGFGTYEGRSGIATIFAAEHVLESERGGWLPLRIVPLVFWFANPNPVVARATQLAIVTADVCLFTTLVALLWRSVALAGLSTVGALLAVQLRKPHDPILGSTLALPLALMFFFASALAFHGYLAGNSKRRLVASIVLLAAACASDETAWILAAYFPVLSLRTASRRTTGFAMLAVPALAMTASAYERHGVPFAVQWLWHPNAADIRRSAMQLLGALPLTYRGFDNLVKHAALVGEVDTRFWGIPALGALGAVATCALALTAFLLVDRVMQQPPSADVRRSVPRGLAGVLFASTALVVDPSVWQGGMPPGEATAAVFTGCFGFGIAFAYVVLAICAALPQESRPVFAPIVALFVGFVAYGNVRTGARVIALDRTAYETVQQIVDGGADGLFDGIPAHTSFAFDGASPLPAASTGGLQNLTYLLTRAGGRAYDATPMASLRPGGRDCIAEGASACRPRADTYIIRRERGGPGNGGLSVSHWSRTRDRRLQIDRSRAFQRQDLAAAPSLSLQSLGGAGLDVRHIDVRDGKTLADVRRTCGPVDIDSALMPDRDRVAYGAGFLPASRFPSYQFAVVPLLPKDARGEQDWRYGERLTTLIVYPHSCRGSHRYLRAAVYAPVPATLLVRVLGTSQILNVSEAGTTLDFPLPQPVGEPAPIFVTLETNAPEAPEELMYPPFDRRRFPPPHLLIVAPRVVDDAPRA